jgi:hypothetical protein
VEPAPPVLTGGTIGVVQMQNHGTVTDAHIEPTGTIRAGGQHHGIIMRNNQGGAEMCTPDHEPFRTLTARCHQSLIVPYQSEPHTAEEPARTVTTVDRLSLLIPASNGGAARNPHTEPSFVQVTQTRPALVELTAEVKR